MAGLGPLLIRQQRFPVELHLERVEPATLVTDTVRYCSPPSVDSNLELVLVLFFVAGNRPACINTNSNNRKVTIDSVCFSQ